MRGPLTGAPNNLHEYADISMTMNINMNITGAPKHLRTSP